jgi:hypothetical protein
MGSSNSIPPIYSKGQVSQLDWNDLMQKKYRVEEYDTTTDSPLTDTDNYENIEIDANSALFTFNLNALSSYTHADITNFRESRRITNKSTSLYNLDVVPAGSDKLRGVNEKATLEPGESISIDALPGGWQ